MRFEFVELKVETKRVVMLVIPAAKNSPTSFAQVRYIRIGSSKEKLERYPDRESHLFHVLRNGPDTMENTASEYQDLEFKKLMMYYAAKGVELNRRSFKKNLGFLTPDGKYNLLAQLMSDNSHVPVRFAVFNGEDKTSSMYTVREMGNTCLLFRRKRADVCGIFQPDRNHIAWEHTTGTNRGGLLFGCIGACESETV